MNMSVKALHVNWDILRKIFGDRWCNDIEKIFCVNVSNVSPDESWQLDDAIPDWRQYHYLISEL